MKTILLLLATSGMPLMLQASDRILEVSGDGKKITASVVFQDESGGITSTQQITEKRFDWMIIPKGAVKYQIKVGEIASETRSLVVEKNTFVKVGKVKQAMDSLGVVQVFLEVTDQLEEKAAPGAEGVILLGQLSSGAEQHWMSLNVVRTEDRQRPDVGNSGNFSDVVSLILNKTVLSDVPLYLRTWSAPEGRPVESPDNKVARPGQQMTILEIKEPTSDGSVFAHVKIN
jgi:hypothetical protein